MKIIFTKKIDFKIFKFKIFEISINYFERSTEDDDGDSLESDFHENLIERELK